MGDAVNRSINLGILAHVDAGKTSLTERLLYQAGAIAHLGSVDSGDTHTDSMALEKARGITIQSSVVSFMLDSLRVNLIDTPGHADFISEVERALSVLDAVVLVVSAVEGVQPSTRVLMSVLSKLKKPTLIFINKIDRSGARCDALVKEMNLLCDGIVMPMVKAQRIACKEASVSHCTVKESGYYDVLLNALAENDEVFLDQCVANDLQIAKDVFIREIIHQTTATSLYPVYFGSAVTGCGIDELLVGITYYLGNHMADADASLSGRIFKIERIVQGEKIAYLDLRSGAIDVRQSLTLYHEGMEKVSSYMEKIARLRVFDQGKLIDAKRAEAGTVVQVYGLKQAAIGDVLDNKALARNGAVFSRPSIVTTVTSDNPNDNARLVVALNELAEQDPLIGLDACSDTGDIVVQLYGEIQKEILVDKLKTSYSIAASFGETRPICIERPLGVGEAVNIMDLHNAPLEFYATLGFRIESGKAGSGIQYEMKSVKGNIPGGYHSVVEDATFRFLRKGLQGWQVTDCVITVTEAGVCPLSISPHFRQLTPILLQQALEKAGTMVCEPYNNFELDTPTDFISQVQAELVQYDVTITGGDSFGDVYRIKGEIKDKHIARLQARLPNLTQGMGVMLTVPSGYKPV